MLQPNDYVNKSFSQFGEDRVLHAWLETLRIESGIYVDVGAHHPFNFSNTALLYAKGWSGVNIEPDPNLFKVFATERPRDLNLNIGCGAIETTLELVIYNHPAANTMDPVMFARQAKNPAVEIVDRIQVPVRPLGVVLQENGYGKIDVLTIDAEGLDFDILKSANLAVHRPTIVLIEDHHFSMRNPQSSEMLAYMESQGYTLESKIFVTLLFRYTG